MDYFSRGLMSDIRQSHSIDLSGYRGSSNPWAWFWRYFIADFAINHFIVMPAVVSCWRGVWDYSPYYIDALIFKESCYRNLIFIGFVGVFGVLLIQISHSFVKKILEDQGSKLRYRFISKLFSISWGFFDIYFWRMVWESADCYFGPPSITLGVCTLSIGLAVLIPSRSFRSALSSPNGLRIDDDKSRVYAATYFSTNTESKRISLFYDSFVSTFLEIFVILSWHGIWTIEDVLSDGYFKVSKCKSAFYSLIIGTCIGILIMFVQFPCYKSIWNKKKMPSWIKYSTNAIFTLVGVIGTVSSFRAAWYIFDCFFLPNNREASLILGQILGVLVLFSFNCGGSLHAGIEKDLSYDEGCLLSLHYLTFYYARDLMIKNTNPTNGPKFPI